MWSGNPKPVWLKRTGQCGSQSARKWSQREPPTRSHRASQAVVRIAVRITWLDSHKLLRNVAGTWSVLGEIAAIIIISLCDLSLLTLNALPLTKALLYSWHSKLVYWTKHIVVCVVFLFCFGLQHTLQPLSAPVSEVNQLLKNKGTRLCNWSFLVPRPARWCLEACDVASHTLALFLPRTTTTPPLYSLHNRMVRIMMFCAHRIILWYCHSRTPKAWHMTF